MNRDQPNPTRWNTWHGVVAVSVLLVTLIPLGWIQWRQIQMLDEVSHNQVDSIMWQAYQLEHELGRLQQSLRQASAEPPGLDPDALVERYEVFLSRIHLLTRIPRRDLLDGSYEYASSIAQVNAFVTLADPLFAQPRALLEDAQQLRQLSETMEQLELPLAELTREANRAVARHLDERNRQLRQQSHLVIGLAGAQALVLLLFVVLLVRHLRKQQDQYARLQQLSRALTEARDQAEAANRGKSIFLANMSHEIRTPFQGLLGMLNLLDDATLSGPQRDHLQTARDSALHLLGVLNDILDVSTMESGTLKLSLAPTHLRAVVQEVDGLMQVAARDKGLTLSVELASDLPQWVMADATRLRQILFNLISNAIKFTPSGSVCVALAHAADGGPGLLLTVRDSGVGMDPETVQRLFTRFYQADNSLRRRIGGTGLGLEISRNLARMMGGDISVSSQPGVGSVFSVTLPLPVVDAPALQALPEPGASQARRLRVLVAEDHPINLKYMAILLEKMGHQATFCENGQEALAWLEAQTFDVVLLDYHMPLLDGLATTEAIRRLDGPAAQTPVILVTADVVNDTRQRALEVGVNEFTSKPLQAHDLQAALARCGLLNAPREPDPALRAPAPDSEAPGLRPETSPVPPQLIDTESYAEIVSMMPDHALQELLKTVFDPPDGTVPLLLQALASGDRQALGDHAHKLKGAAMLMGFRALAQSSAQLEQWASQADLPWNASLGEQLSRDAQQTQQALRLC